MGVIIASDSHLPTSLENCGVVDDADSCRFEVFKSHDT
jgi:hypothetical protein